MTEQDERGNDLSFEIKNWRKSKKHLPKFMRDFHDQKDLFKAIDQIIVGESNERISWVEAHIYTIDVFLWFMARYGYTLQKTRANLEFRDIQKDIDLCREDRDKYFQEVEKR